MDDDAEKLRQELRRMADKLPEIPTGYFGTAVWIRIQHRFRTRRTEWGLAFITALLGIVMLLPGEMFAFPGYAGFRAIFGSEMFLGVGLLVLGILRIGGLIVNGARKNVTPHIRMASAACGCLIFAGICYCHWLSGIWGAWIAIYPVFVIGEFSNVYTAAHDVGEANGRTR
jgi:hypothetical protein